MIGTSGVLPSSFRTSTCSARVPAFTTRLSKTTRIFAASDPDPEQQKDIVESKPGFGIDELGPVQLGRKSRQAFDDLWTQFATLASPTSSFSESEFYEDTIATDPEARSTKVLVIGGTGRIGRNLVRKLLLRGYQVRTLVRKRSAMEDLISARVEVVTGNILDNDICQQALYGVDKVVFAAGTRSTDPEEYRLIFQKGLKNVLHAFMDYKWVTSKKKVKGNKKSIANFKGENVVESWKAEVLGHVSRFEGEMEDILPRVAELNGIRQWSQPQNSIIVKRSTNNTLQFRGAVNEIGSAAEIGADVQQEKLKEYEGVILRVRGDGHIYAVVCTMDDGRKYSARFATKWGYSTVRIPFTLFRPDWGGSESLASANVVKIGIRFENRGRSAAASAVTEMRPPGRFNLDVEWIKTLPAAKSTEFVMISCAGVPRPDIEIEDLEEILLAQRLGEAMLRNSGVGYTIIRPTTLVDEPGGLKALVFDQADRLSQSISSVDVADVSVRALPQPLASNKTFEVAHEDTSFESEDEEYELVAHVPDKSTNYLGAALANLEKNT